MRVLHTADLHLDTRFTGSGLQREQVMERRNDLLGVFGDIVSLAREREVDLLLIAGDLFEDGFVNGATVTRMFAGIAGIAPTPVVIAPGNHDYYHPSSPYASGDLPANLSVFRSGEMERIDFQKLETAIYGRAFHRSHESRQFLSGFRVDESDWINVVLCHGAVYAGEPQQAKEYGPINPDDLRRSGADYCALGHYHRQVDVWSDERGLRAAYPGSPEPLRYGHTGEHGVLLVEITSNGGPIKVERLSTQRKRYFCTETDLSDCRDISEIDRKIGRELGRPELKDNLVEIVLRGLVSAGVSLRESDYAEAAGRLFDLRMRDLTQPDYDLESIAGEGTSRGAFCRLLLQRIEESGEEERGTLEQALRLGLAAFDGQDVEEFPL
jgi:DNA repair exonuclease SbcCD nuclease subunit